MPDARETLYPWEIDCDDTEPDLPAVLTCPACVALGSGRMCAPCVDATLREAGLESGEGGAA